MIVEHFIYNYIPMGVKIKICERVFNTDIDECSHYEELYCGESRHSFKCGYDLKKYRLTLIFIKNEYLIIECMKIEESAGDSNECI